MDDNASSNALTPIACRLIANDQWLVTHVDAAWTIKDVKMWILGKCIPSMAASNSRPSTPMMPSRHPRPRPSSPIVFAPDPHHRPMSPITFAQPVDPNRKNDLSDDENDHGMGSTADGEGEERESEGEYLSGGRIAGTNKRSDSRPDAYNPHHRPSPSYASSQAEPHDPTAPYAQYTLVRFSTGQLLEDDLTLSMYDIRPYEMLEVHKSNVIVNLPRQFLREYIQPYWEGPIKVLRHVWRDDPLHHRNAVDANNQTHPDARSEYFRDRNRHHRTLKTIEWRERWIVIRNGELLVFKDRRATEPSQNLLFANLSFLQGTDYLRNRVNVNPEQRIMCAKFRTPEKSARSSRSETPRPADTSSPPQYTTTTTITAGTPPKNSTKKKLQIRSSFPSSSSLRSNGKPSSSKGLSESSSKTNLNSMFTMSGWKNESLLRKKKKQKKSKDKGKGKAEAEPAEDSATPREVSRDKGKGKAVAGPQDDLLHPDRLHPPTDACHDDDKETILSSPVFARTSGSDDETDASEYGRGGPWRSKGGYGYKVGYRYVDYVGRGAGDGDQDPENMSGDGMGPGTGAESGTGEDDKDMSNEAGTFSGFGSAPADSRTSESSALVTVDSHSLETRPDELQLPLPDRGSVHFGRRTLLESHSGEWIIMDVGDDHAFSSLLRIFHRLFPDPIRSAFVSGLGALNSPTSSPLHSPTAPTPPSRAPSIHNPSMKSASSSQDSLIGSTYQSNRTTKSRRSRRTGSTYSGATSVQTNTFGALPYPEWRVDIAVKAQKAGMGDVGRAMGWMLWGRCLTSEDDSMKEDMRSMHSSLRSKGSKGRRKSRQVDEASLVSRDGGKPVGSSSRKSVRSNNSTLTPTPSMKEPADPYASDVSGGVSSEESQFGLDGSDESDGYSSEAEWQGWMADLHRQARVRQLQAEAAKNAPSNDDGEEEDSKLSFPWISGGWNQSPYLTPGASGSDMPQSQMQALRLYQEGRRALEPSAVVISVGQPPVTTPPPPPPPPTTTTITTHSHQPHAIVPPLSSPSSSESLATSQRPRGMSFSPIDQPSSATPISAYSQYPLEADKLDLMTSSSKPLPVPPYGATGTPTPKKLNFPPPLAFASTGGQSPPDDSSLIHHHHHHQVRTTSPHSATPSSFPTSELHHAYSLGGGGGGGSSAQRRASSAGIMIPSLRNGDGATGAATMGFINNNEGPGGSPKHQGNSSSSNMLTLPASFKGHRPRLSVTTTTTTTSHAAGGGGSPPATQTQTQTQVVVSSPHAQSPTKSAAKRILHRMRSGSSMRGERHDVDHY